LNLWQGFPIPCQLWTELTPYICTFSIWQHIVT
jgi:hypothetical protein